MTMTIRSKVHNYGNEKESSWPSQFGTGEKGLFYVRDGKLNEGYPPPRHERLGTPPMVIFDSMPKTYHEGVGREIESRKEWELADKQAGTLTFGSKESARPQLSEEQKFHEHRKSLKRTAIEAVKAWKDNPELVTQKAQKLREKQQETAEKNGLNDLLKDI